MKKRIAFILQNVSLLLLITAIPGQFVFEGNSFDIYYAVSTCAGVSLLLISFAIYQGEWGFIPIAVVFGLIGIYFSIDFSILDELVQTKKSGIFILTTSFICYVLILIKHLWHK